MRSLAIKLVGRLADKNPAYVNPALRRHLLQLLTDMEHSPDAKYREGAQSREAREGVQGGKRGWARAGLQGGKLWLLVSQLVTDMEPRPHVKQSEGAQTGGRRRHGSKGSRLRACSYTISYSTPTPFVCSGRTELCSLSAIPDPCLGCADDSFASAPVPALATQIPRTFWSASLAQPPA